MSEVSINAAFRKVDKLVYVKTLELHIPGYLIHARLMHLNESTTNSSYDVYVARDHGQGKSPEIVRDWTMRGFYQPRGHGESLEHRKGYGGTVYTLGGLREATVKNNLIAAIFDSLLGSCEFDDLDVLIQYKDAAFAMFSNGVVPLPITDSYRASVLTPDDDITAVRVWFVNADGFTYQHTTWTLHIDRATRLTYRDDVTPVSYRKAREFLLNNTERFISSKRA